MITRNVLLVAGVLVLIIVVFLRYQIAPSSDVTVFMLDRWTGELTACREKMGKDAVPLEYVCAPVKRSTR